MFSDTGLLQECINLQSLHKVFEKTALKVSVYQTSSLLENLYYDHKFPRKCGQGESFCRYLSSQYVLKTC